ncbi:helix-turn-helix domain-containing protein [uncultured Pontibacter sp.]|uniref:helix-turn-helix domain-containing protein n=1 Tax=uncultured Pontibacter sp. TaxID=453356 RepID=UPI002601C8FF|nr:helix-turn-helix domain-containing protein [uncultured Pontibacter sp.]
MENPFEILDTRLRSIEAMLQLFYESVSNRQQSKRFITTHTLTVKEAAEVLNVSKSTIYSYVSKQEIPVYKRGKYLYFSEDELLTWLKAGRRQTTHEISNEAIQGVVMQHRKRSR